MMKYKAVIFDMDGVLIDSEPLHKIIGLKMIQELRIPPNIEIFKRFTGTTVISMWEILAQEFPLKQNPDELASIYNNRFAEKLKTSNNVLLFEGIIDVLEMLKNKGIQVALASSSSREIVDTVLNKFGLNKYFSVTVTGSDVKHSKPHPEIFLTASKKLDVSPSYCIVVEDSPNGVKAALLAGMGCIGFESGKDHLDISEAKWILKSFKDFDYGLLA